MSSTQHSVVPIAVVGPTATGKSDVALEVAARIGGEIVNLDAMQQYRGMDIGTAKLAVAARRGVPHHQIDVLDVTETATVARYQQAAAADVERLLADGRTPVLVGGSMMYYQGLLDNWNFPATDPKTRQRYEALLAEVGTNELHRRLATVDPQAASSILPTDGRRIVRALEVVELTGKPFAASAPRIGEPRWRTRVIGVDLDTDVLDERIGQRTRRMFDSGLVAEVRSLLDAGLRGGRTASRAIGYAQVIAALDGEYDMATAEDLTVTGTRRYVRRQRSWFRRDHRITWLDAARPNLPDVVLRTLEG